MGRSFPRLVLTATCSVLVAAVVGPASAGADTLRFGSTLPAPTPGTYDSCSVPCTLAQLGVPGTQLVSPVSGTITSFRLRSAAGSVPQSIRFRVLRSEDGTRYTGAGTSAPVPVPTTAGITKFPVSMAVEAGDAIGIDQPGGSVKANIVAYNPGAFQGAWFPTLGDGVAAKPSDNPQGSEPTRYELLLQAEVEYEPSEQVGCTDPKTLTALCADANAPPAICGPFTSFPQCNVPVSLPSACSGTGTAFPVCNLPGNHIVACGGFGLNLPVCDLPPLEIPQVCGPTTAGLKPCAPANVQVLACGPTDLGFPPCAFETLIKAPKPIGLDGGELDHETAHGLDLSTTLGCPGEEEGGGRRGDGGTCVATVDLIALAEAKIGALSLQSKALSQLFEQVSEGMSVPAAANAAAFRDRTDHEIDVYIVRPLGRNEQFRPMSSNDRAETVRRLSRADGVPKYKGPAEIYDNYLTRGAVSGWTDSLGAAVGELAKVQKQAKKGGRSGTPASNELLQARAAKPGRPLLEKRVTLSRAEPTKVKLRLKKNAIVKLLGKKPRKARALPVRFVVSYDAEPRPIARYVDFALTVKRR